MRWMAALTHRLEQEGAALSASVHSVMLPVLHSSLDMEQRVSSTLAELGSPLSATGPNVDCEKML